MHAQYAPNLSILPARDPDRPDDVTVVVETSKGSRNKFGFDPASGTFRLKHVLPEGSAFPYDFGFVPSTKGGDGDPLDVLVFLDEPAPLGCVVSVRLIGVIEARQREASGEWVENNRLLGVAVPALAQAHVKTLEDLRPHLLDEIEAFFVQYNHLRGTTFEVQGRGGPDRAHALIEDGVAAGAGGRD